MNAKKPGATESFSVEADAVRELAALMNETGLTEIEIERGGTRLRVTKQGVYATPMPMHAAPALAPAAASNPAEAPMRGTVITSPMVGTVYLSPQPGAPAFVKVGDTVKKEDTVCIVEAMKTMNPVGAIAGGRIVEIFLHDGQPVEFGEPIMRIE